MAEDLLSEPGQDLRGAETSKFRVDGRMPYFGSDDSLQIELGIGHISTGGLVQREGPEHARGSSVLCSCVDGGHRRLLILRPLTGPALLNPAEERAVPRYYAFLSIHLAVTTRAGDVITSDLVGSFSQLRYLS